MLLWVSWLSEIKVMNPEFQFLPFLVRNIRCLVSTVCFWRTDVLQKRNVFDVYTLQVLTTST